MVITLHITKGDIVLQMMVNEAPNTVANFERLSKEGFYDGTKFHRVIDGFIVQGGDPFTKDDSLMERWGTGGPGYRFPDEIHENNNNEVGTISMANAGPDTNGSQFFFNTADNEDLNLKHTVFGKVIDGYEVIKKIEKLPTGKGGRPYELVEITSVSVA